MIGVSKNKVINNIKKATEKGEYNTKVENGDPNLTQKQEEQIIERYIKDQDKLSYKIKTKIVRIIISIATKIINKDTKIEGIENIKDIKTGAIITSNHFNPLDNLIIQKLIRKLGKKRLYIVSQVSNFAMEGFIGFLMNYSDTIPLSKQVSFMKKQFAKFIKSKLKKNDYILIYPEEEMWFNYRKPRPLKQGAYYYAAKNNVPIISCFTEIIDEDEKYNYEFYAVKHILHVLPPIYPDPNKTTKENSIEMMEKDYKQKKQAYESAYHKKLDYTFNKEDIAGWIRFDKEKSKDNDSISEGKFMQKEGM